MIRIGLISDTHGYLDKRVFEHFKDVDEVWHAGDFGGLELLEELKAFKPLRGVWGNIDGSDIRQEFPEVASFSVEGVKVLMIHIGGYPGKYSPKAKAELAVHKPQLFISGHSHILKVMYDDKLQCLHMNPGAAGQQGWHQVRTLIRFVIDGDKMRGCEVIELGKKGAL
jgi:putative phosphoesterase